VIFLTPEIAMRLKTLSVVVLVSGAMVAGAMAGNKGKAKATPTTAPSTEVIGQTGTIKGIVIGQDGKPAAGVSVEVRKAEKVKRHKAIQVTRTGADGSFVFEHVPAGSLRVVAGGTGAGIGTGKVTVSAGGTADAAVTLKAAKKGKGKKAGEVQPVEPVK